MPEQTRSAERPSEPQANDLTALLGFWLAQQTTAPSGRTARQPAQPDVHIFLKQPPISGLKGVPAGSNADDFACLRVGNRFTIELFVCQ